MGAPTVRNLLAALGLLVAIPMLYQGLVVGGVIAGADAPRTPEIATFLLIAGSTVLLAVVTLRWSPGIAAIETALAGFVTVIVADPAHRYLAAYGVAAVALALAMLVTALGASPPATPRGTVGPRTRRGPPRAPRADCRRRPARMGGVPVRTGDTVRPRRARGRVGQARRRLRDHAGIVRARR